MSKFSKGNKVINSTTNEAGVVVEVYPPRRGRQLYKVRYAAAEKDENSAVLVPDTDLANPFERCRQNIYGSYSEYVRDNTMFKVYSANASIVSTLKASRTLFRPYQFKPLLKFISSGTRRLLIADEVGLGKTIEAGHIMLEMKARGELHNVLVVCPNALKAKWVVELTEKFGIQFVDITDKEQLLEEFRKHNGFVRAVVNYEKMGEKSDIVERVVSDDVRLSLVVCDESHKLRNDDTSRYRAMRRVLDKARAVVFLSATPIMISEENLYNQLRLLDADHYGKRDVFHNNLQLNRPFVRALSGLGAGAPLTEVATQLSEAEVEIVHTINGDVQSRHVKVDEYFRDYPMYAQIMRDLTCGDDTPAVRARLRYNMSEMSPMSKIFSRTRKREVIPDWSQAERWSKRIVVDLSDGEAEKYDSYVEDYVADMDDTGILGLKTRERQLASSVWGFFACEGDLSEGVDAFAAFADAKVDALLGILAKHGKVIVFAVFRKTLKYLAIRLARASCRCAVILGGSAVERNAAICRFREDDGIKVLLSSEVGSEGLDMQFCDTIVNYDLPWNPMVVEQRIGRIDRFGQASPVVNIYTLVVRNSILEEIYSRLLYRIGIFREAIGDLEAILDADMDGGTIQDALNAMQKDCYANRLTKDEMERKGEEIAQAIENEKLNLRHIEEDLTDTLSNDSYFQNETNRILRRRAYVTGTELRQFVGQMLREHIPTCELRFSDEAGVWELVMPQSDPGVLRRFLLRYQPADEDSRRLFCAYMKEIDGKRILPLTFDQEEAYRQPQLSHVNIYHPIVRAGMEYFSSHPAGSTGTFAFEISVGRMPQGITRGIYMLAIYKVALQRRAFGRTVDTETLYPLLYDVAGGCMVDDRETVETFLGRAQTEGRHTTVEVPIDSDILDDMRCDMEEEINKYVAQYERDNRIKTENALRMRREQVEEYYELRITRLKKSIESQQFITEMNLDKKAQAQAEAAKKLHEANLHKLKGEMEKELGTIDRERKVKVSEVILSLNYVKVV